MRFTRFKRILLGRCKTSVTWNGKVCKGLGISWFWLLLSQWQPNYIFFVLEALRDHSVMMKDQRKTITQDGWVASKHSKSESLLSKHFHLHSGLNNALKKSNAIFSIAFVIQVYLCISRSVQNELAPIWYFCTMKCC